MSKIFPKINVKFHSNVIFFFLETHSNVITHNQTNK